MAISDLVTPFIFLLDWSEGSDALSEPAVTLIRVYIITVALNYTLSVHRLFTRDSWEVLHSHWCLHSALEQTGLVFAILLTLLVFSVLPPLSCRTWAARFPGWGSVLWPCSTPSSQNQTLLLQQLDGQGMRLLLPPGHHMGQHAKVRTSALEQWYLF